MSKLLFFIFTLLSYQVGAASELVGKTFLFKYEGDQHYKVSFSEGKVRWEGVKGDELGRSATDPYQSEAISDGVHFIQWSEADGTFVALTVNLKSKKIVSTGLAGKYKWFRKGQFDRI